MKTLALILCGLVLSGFAALMFNYTRHDLEVADIDEELRKSAPGMFVKTSAGYTHYQIAGPPASSPASSDDERVVVLVHGFSVPYYLWTGTFEMLGNAGFKALRYDLY